MKIKNGWSNNLANPTSCSVCKVNVDFSDSSVYTFNGEQIQVCTLCLVAYDEETEHDEFIDELETIEAVIGRITLKRNL